MKTAYLNIVRAAVVALCAAIIPAVSAADLNVRGTVTRQGTGETIEGVVIFDSVSERILGTTNAYGEYSVTIDENGTLLFVVLGCKDLQEPVNGRIKLDVALFPDAHSLRELVVTGKNKNNGLILPNADIIQDGNTLRFTEPVTIPHQIFSSNVRMIIQPAFYNVTKRTMHYLKPTVFDGFRYDITQRRMYDWDSDKDPLHEYVTVKRTGGRTDDTVYLVDSLYVDNPKNDFLCVVMSSMENYNGIIYSDTSQIARGSINPLRLLAYSIDGVPFTDENFIPRAELQKREANGEVKLEFRVGKADLDLSLGDNAAEMEKMLAEFRTIQDDPDMTLRGFEIIGTASPEGSYDANKALAARRTKAALNKILSEVPAYARKSAYTESKANVATWDQVADLLRADGRNEEADAVMKIVDANSRDISRQSYLMRRLPFYSLLTEKYLPRLRKVEYHIVSTRYRPLTPEEINDLYNKDYRSLSRYHFWSLYHETTDTMKREEIMRRAIEVHPDFIAAASDLTASMISRDAADESILRPYFADWTTLSKQPLEARHNLAVACMAGNHFSYADSLLYTVPDEPRFHKAKIYCSALNGRYTSVVQEIAQDSPLNETLILLKLNDNNRAFEKASALGNSAEEEYAKAIAANRLANAGPENAYLYVEAGTHLANAIHLKPELLDIARIDADVRDLLDEDGNLIDDGDYSQEETPAGESSTTKPEEDPSNTESNEN